MSDAFDRPATIASQLQRAVPGCPITRGLPTRMTRSGFKRLCERHRDQPDGYCKEVCRGERIPAELEFIDIPQGGEDMGSTKYTNGKCRVCGEIKSVKNSASGAQVCSNCDGLWRQVNNRPEKVLEALLEKMGAAWVQERVPADWVQPVPTTEPSPVDQGELEALRETLGDLQVSYEELVEMNGRQRRELESLGRQRDYLTEQLAHLQDLRDSRVPVATATDQPADPTRDSILLNLAIGMLDGSVTGVDVDSLKTLRQ